MRIAIAGFQHETNTFVAQTTPLANFERADSWPELMVGQAVIDQTKGMNLPTAGFVEAAIDGGAELFPVLWCAAEPSGRVEDEAFDAICGRILDGIAKAGPIDAVYLDLHGAMVTQSSDDGEGDLLAHLRRALGPDIPIVASLDLHANVSPAMVEAADALLIFRTYPHLDMAETGARAYQLLAAINRKGRPAKAFRQGDYLIPLHVQHTGADPARSLYARCGQARPDNCETIELALGFTAADTVHTRPCVLAYAETEAEASQMADELAEALEQSEDTFDCHLPTARDAVRMAMTGSESGPVIIADVQDNPGAGARSDSTGLLRELLAEGANNVILGLIHDPELAQMAHGAGLDMCFDAKIGGNGPGDAPLSARVRVHHLSDGLCTYTGEMYGGGRATLGPSAALQIEGKSLHIVVTSIPNQCLDQAHFRHFNLDPEAASIICVKSTAHFRADFEGIATKVILAAAPGEFPCVLEDAEYFRVDPNVRLGPSGPTTSKRIAL